MAREPPMVLRMTPALLDAASPWVILLEERLDVSRTSLVQLASRFEFKNDEKRFVRELFARKPNLWVFRCDQQQACGDFVLVDMSSPVPALRKVLVVDLKQGGALKLGGGGAGVQFQNAGQAVATIAQERGIILEQAAFERVSGSLEEILRYLGVDRP